MFETIPIAIVGGLLTGFFAGVLPILRAPSHGRQGCAPSGEGAVLILFGGGGVIAGTVVSAILYLVTVNALVAIGVPAACAACFGLMF